MASIAIFGTVLARRGIPHKPRAGSDALQLYGIGFLVPLLFSQAWVVTLSIPLRRLNLT